MNIKLCYSVYMKIKNFSIKTFVELICSTKHLLNAVSRNKSSQSKSKVPEHKQNIWYVKSK